MPRTKQAPMLDLQSSQSVTSVDSQVRAPLSPSTTMSPTSPRSPRSPQSPTLKEATIRPVTDLQKQSLDYTNASDEEMREAGLDNGPKSPSITAIPQYPPSPTSSPKHARDPSRSFFSNLMASKSSHRLHSPERSAASTPTTQRAPEKDSKSRTSSKERNVYSRQGRGSTPDLHRQAQAREKADDKENRAIDQEPQPDIHGSQADTTPLQPGSTRKPKPKLGGLLQRTRSIKTEEGSRPRVQTPPQKLNLERRDSGKDAEFQQPMKTAPMPAHGHPERDRTLKEAAKTSARTRSADRNPQEPSSRAVSSSKKEKGSVGTSSSFRDGAGAQLLSNLSQTSRSTADRIGKAGKGFFGKIGRSGSSNEREIVTDDNYRCTVITLPLVQQTRRTRIAKRLELSRDKTEFWMPALPWRCIDYLNMNGVEEEGLYRIPGSGKEVKHWQRRFDTERDINLFDEPELYDINTIGSMFKAWLRDLPDEILPKTVQNLVAEKCMGQTKTPQLLKDELSKLPPFNYYLLFAITCHLSLLHSFSDKNKMDYRNLCICFQPCLKIDGFCFQFLVQDWKNCWQGCWTEKEYLEEEYRWEREGEHAVESHSADERAISSSDSGQQRPAQPQSQSQSRVKDFAGRSASPTKTGQAITTNGNSRKVNNTSGKTGKTGKTGNTNGNLQAGQDQMLPEVQLGAPLSPIKIP